MRQAPRRLYCSLANSNYYNSPLFIPWPALNSIPATSYAIGFFPFPGWVSFLLGDGTSPPWKGSASTPKSDPMDGSFRWPRGPPPSAPPSGGQAKRVPAMILQNRPPNFLSPGAPVPYEATHSSILASLLSKGCRCLDGSCMCMNQDTDLGTMPVLHEYLGRIHLLSKTRWLLYAMGRKRLASLAYVPKYRYGHPSPRRGQRLASSIRSLSKLNWQGRRTLRAASAVSISLPLLKISSLFLSRQSWDHIFISFCQDLVEGHEEDSKGR